MCKINITSPKWLRATWDYIVVIFGLLTLILCFVKPDSTITGVFSILAGIAGFIYVILAIILFFGSRARFDWRLVNGNYILKVVALVILTPFWLSLLMGVVDNRLISEDMLYESNLYQTKEPSKDVVDRQENPPLIWTIYFHFMDPGNQHMTASKPGRAWSAIIAILGVFLLSGLMVSSIIGWIDSRKERWMKGDVRYKGLLGRKPHYIIIGANDMVEGIVLQLLNKDKACFEIFKPYILIQTSQDVETFRQILYSNLTVEQQKRIIIYYGNRNSKVDISELNLNKAKEVYILGEDARVDDLESYHDTMNMECLKLISENISSCPEFFKTKTEDKRLVCRVMFEYQTSFNVFKVTDINADKIKFLPFNYYEKWAQNVLICQKTDPEDIKKGPYLPLEGPHGIKAADDAFVHLIIVGMSRMGIALAIEAAHLAHYPNYKKRRTKITFIDKTVDVEKDFFMNRFKALFALSHWRYGVPVGEKIVFDKDHEIKDCEHLGGDFIDVEWEFIKAPVQSHAVQQYIVDSSNDEHARLTIAVCIPENSRAIAAAAYLPDSVYESDSTLQVLVYQRLNGELVRQISNNNGRYSKKIKAFGMASMCYDSDLVELSEHMANAISVAYDKYMAKFNEEKAQALAELMTQVPAEQNAQPEEKKAEDKPADKKDGGNKGKTAAAKMWSNNYNIHSMWTKFRSVTTSDGKVFDPLNTVFDKPESVMMKELGQIEHNRWNMEQLLLRIRPLTKDEQKQAKIETLTASNEMKEFYKSKFAHLDICSNEVLDKIDYKMSELDKALIEVLPSAYRKYMSKKENDGQTDNRSIDC